MEGGDLDVFLKVVKQKLFHHSFAVPASVAFNVYANCSDAMIIKSSLSLKMADLDLMILAKLGDVQQRRWVGHPIDDQTIVLFFDVERDGPVKRRQQRVSQQSCHDLLFLLFLVLVPTNQWRISQFWDALGAFAAFDRLDNEHGMHAPPSG